MKVSGFYRPSELRNGHTEASTPALIDDLIHQRKLYPRVLRDYLTSALAVRQAADYGESGISAKIARRQGAGQVNSSTSPKR